MRFANSAVFALALALAVAACRPCPSVSLPHDKAGVEIRTVALSLSNVHVVIGEHPVLVDTGSPGELKQLESDLRRVGVALADVKCAVVTHGHADHAGTARQLQLRGIKLIAGRGDLWRELRGVHGTLKATSFFAVLLKVLIPARYLPFWPDVRVVDRFDLHECGVDGEVRVVGAHTAGSVVVIVGGGKVALVGDLFRGGALGGYVRRGSPKEHFYQEDLALAHQRIRELLAAGVEYFILGHGGPAKRADVARLFGR